MRWRPANQQLCAVSVSAEKILRFDGDRRSMPGIDGIGSLLTRTIMKLPPIIAREQRRAWESGTYYKTTKPSALPVNKPLQSIELAAHVLQLVLLLGKTAEELILDPPNEGSVRIKIQFLF